MKVLRSQIQEVIILGRGGLYLVISRLSKAIKCLRKAPQTQINLYLFALA